MKHEFETSSGQTTKLAFTVRERFGAGDGERWIRYVTWARLPQLRELVSLDGLLCPRVVELDCDEDWEHNMHEDFLCNLFWDLDYVRRKIPTGLPCQLLAAARNPAEDPKDWVVPTGFVFVGHDLIDRQTSISALTNCGGFDDVFRPEELSELGLIPQWPRACEIQRQLAKSHPGEPHAQCDVWSVWRFHDSKSE